MQEQILDQAPRITGKILLVDDDEPFRLSTCELLNRKGFECFGAATVEEAVSCLQSTQIDLLISDIYMPGNDDLRLARAVDSLMPGLPIIILTGQPSLETAIESFSVKARAYLLKPVDLADLLTSIESCIGSALLLREISQMEKNLESWKSNLKQFRRTLAENKSPVGVSAQHFITICANHMQEAFTNISGAVNSALRSDSRKNVCKLFQCPRLDARDDLINKTIAVLDETKRSFKSKALGELRKDLEHFIEKSGKDSPE